MPKHIVRLIMSLGIVILLVIGAKALFTADSFGVYGHYRANAVPEIAADTPKYRGPDYCQLCHSERHAVWSAHRHGKVKCEVCHGPAGEHPATGKLPIPSDTVRLCSTCHEAMPARPAAQPQIVVSQHSGAQPCIACHNPHAPRIASSGGSDQ